MLSVLYSCEFVTSLSESLELILVMRLDGGGEIGDSETGRLLLFVIDSFP